MSVVSNSSNQTNKVKLPSISELTSNANLVSYQQALSPTSGGSRPGSVDDSRRLSHPKASSNYILGRPGADSNQILPTPYPGYYEYLTTATSISPPPIHPFHLKHNGFTPSVYVNHGNVSPQFNSAHHPLYHSPLMPSQSYIYPPPSSYGPAFYHVIQGEESTAGPKNSSTINPTEKPSAYRAPEVINKKAYKCHRCGTTETPEWRSGPNGVRTLCNACGLFHSKLVKKIGASLAAGEVLNNKVRKGKNGRRVSVKKQKMKSSKNELLEGNDCTKSYLHEHPVDATTEV